MSSKEMLKNWKEYFKRSPSERRLLQEAFWRLQLTSIGLKRLGYQKVYTLQSQASLSKDNNADRSQKMTEINKISEIVKVAANHSILPTTCLSRSIVLYRMLRKRNFPAKVQIGVRYEGGHIQAHAWVESLGMVINDLPDVSARFATFDQSAQLKESFFQ